MTGFAFPALLVRIVSLFRAGKIDQAADAGMCSGHTKGANGAYASVATISEAVTTPIAGTSLSLRSIMMGPTA